MNAKEIKRVCMNVFISTERKAHVPLPAAAVIAYGFEVVVTGNHLNRTAGSGYVARLVGLLEFYSLVMIAHKYHSSSLSCCIT